MSIFTNYLSKYNAKPQYIDAKPNSDLNTIIVIPCHNEPDLISSLKSLDNCIPPEKSVEVITVINSSENSDPEIIARNKQTLTDAKNATKDFTNNKIKYHFIEENSLPHKFAGVGLARKIGMDEAVRRFSAINKTEGIIAGFDADAKVDTNYLIEIEKHFDKNEKTNACSINFEHPISGSDFDKRIYTNIIEYELHLRYFVESLRYTNFPYAYQTIGSSFAVRANIYMKQGGMNRKKAGEDFYFLQKIIPLGNYTELNSTKVIPSPRTSDRVPFGTGAAIKNMIQNSDNDYFTYNFDTFTDIKKFIEKKDNFFKNNSPFDNNIPESIKIFLETTNFENDLKKINSNSPNLQIFTKRFFDWFNAFRIIKYLNFIHETYYEKTKVSLAAKTLLSKLNINFENLKTSKELLIFFRNNKSN